MLRRRNKSKLNIAFLVSCFVYCQILYNWVSNSVWVISCMKERTTVALLMWQNSNGQIISKKENEWMRLHVYAYLKLIWFDFSTQHFHVACLFFPRVFYASFFIVSFDFSSGDHMYVWVYCWFCILLRIHYSFIVQWTNGTARDMKHKTNHKNVRMMPCYLYE